MITTDHSHALNLAFPIRRSQEKNPKIHSRTPYVLTTPEIFARVLIKKYRSIWFSLVFFCNLGSLILRFFVFSDFLFTIWPKIYIISITLDERGPKRKNLYKFENKNPSKIKNNHYYLTKKLVFFLCFGGFFSQIWTNFFYVVKFF